MEMRGDVQMKKNIILAGLIYDTNLGDRAIYECSLKMIEDSLIEMGVKDVEIRHVDLYGRVSETNHSRARRRAANMMWRLLRNAGFSREKITVNRVIRNLSAQINSNTKGIIFVGGGLIKFGTKQKLSDSIIAIINVSNTRNIPVMFSAVGIEGYDDSDECQSLQRALNSNNVKMITTRDDIETLTNFYLKNDYILSASVADPACSINELYQREISKEKIGLGIIRSNIFAEYGVEWSEQDALKLYLELYNSVIREGYTCDLFCNGLQADYDFAKKVAHYIEENSAKKIEVQRPRKVEDLVGIITSYKAIIAGRLHSCIIAYAYDIPAIGLVWNEKQVMFGENIGYESRFIKQEDFEEEYIISKLLQSIKEGYGKVDKREYTKSTAEYLKKYIESIIVEA